VSVPGHELAGAAVRVGEKVTKIKAGDQVWLGCMVDSCGNCRSCKAGQEQKCMKQVSFGGWRVKSCVMVFTYSSNAGRNITRQGRERSRCSLATQESHPRWLK